MRGIFGSIETSLLGSIDAKGVVALAAISPAAAAGRISYTATLRSTGVLDGTVHVIGEQDHRVVLFKEPAQASPRANQAASSSHERGELDHLAGTWETEGEQPLRLRLELTQDGGTLGGQCLLTVDSGSDTCYLTGSTGNEGFSFRLESASVVLDFAGAVLSNKKMWLETTGPGEVAEPLFLVLTRQNSESNTTRVGFDSLWELYAGHWRGNGKTWAAELNLEFSPADEDGSAELEAASADLRFGADRRNYRFVGGKGTIADAGFAVISLCVTGVDDEKDFVILMLYADAMNRVHAQLTGQRGSAFPERITLIRSTS